MNVVTRTEFAINCGISHGYLATYILRGKIKTIQGLIDTDDLSTQSFLKILALNQCGIKPKRVNPIAVAKKLRFQEFMPMPELQYPTCKKKSSRADPEYVKAYQKSPEYKAIRNQQMKSRKQNDPMFALTTRTRNMIYLAFKKHSIPKTNTSREIIGCSFKKLKSHIESLFTDGMSWDNFGKWHIDHRIPLNLAKNENDLKTLNYYTNLQPLWGIDNLKKGHRI